jgi:hypothetical protein
MIVVDNCCRDDDGGGLHENLEITLEFPFPGMAEFQLELIFLSVKN